MKEEEVVVWTKPNCVMCDKTMYWLDNHNIPYWEEDITAPESAEALAMFKAQGYASAPIVVVGGNLDIWAGFNQKKLEEHFG